MTNNLIPRGAVFEIAGPNGLNHFNVVDVADLAKNLQAQLSLTASHATGIAELVYHGQTTVTRPGYAVRRYAQLYMELDAPVIGSASRKRRGTGRSRARKPEVQPQPSQQLAPSTSEVKETRGRSEKPGIGVLDTPLFQALKEQ
jgi:hypothetical protein